MKQIKLTLDLESQSKLRLDLGFETKRELVLLMAQAIVAVHLEAGTVAAKQASDDDDDE